MVDFHTETKRLIDTEMTEVFQTGGSFAYSGPAAEALMTSHTSYQKYFDTLVSHAQTQQSRHTTLAGHTTHFLGQAHSAVFGLPAPMAAVGVMSFEFVAPAESALGGAIAGLAEGAAVFFPEDIPILPIIAVILLILVIIAVLILLFIAVKDAIEEHQRQQHDTTVPQPKPEPVPTPNPNPWPYIDPFPPDIRRDDPCLKDVPYVKDLFPQVRADVIAYLLCICGLSKEEIVKYFQYWTAHGMSQQDINNMIDRLRNLRVQQRQLRPDQIATFLKKHYQDVPDIWQKYEQIQNIPGIDQVLRDLTAGAGPKYRGSYFQLNWIVDRQQRYHDVNSVEVFDTNNQQGADIILNNGTVVDVKSYIWKDQGFLLDRGITEQEITDQLQHYNTDPRFNGKPIVYVFNSEGGKIPADIQKIFDNARQKGINVTVKYWPNPDPPVVVP
jgi:hypothetical protein